MESRVIRNLLSSFLLCFLLTQCSTPLGSTQREQTLRSLGYQALKLDRVENDSRFSHVFHINGQPMRLLIDSGANSTDVDGALADRAGVERLKSVSVLSRGALGRTVKSGYGRGVIQAGPVVAANFPLTLSQEGRRPTATSRYAGQIGLDGLNAFGALIDIPRAKLWVPGPNSRQARTGKKAPLGVVPALGDQILVMQTAGRLPHLIIEGQVAGRRTSWVVDTGAEVSVMAEESFRHFGLPSHASDSKIIDASGDKTSIRYAELNNVTFEGVLVRRFHVAVASLDVVRDVFRDSRGRPVDGIIGMDFLQGGNALIDSESRLLYLSQR